MKNHQYPLRPVARVTLFLFLLLCLSPLKANAAGPAVAIPERAHVCMMQDTVLAAPGIPLSHGGRTYYGCCEMCKEKIAAEPARYTLGRDPVSGAPVDKATATLLSINGRVFYFESETTREQFRARLK